MDEPAVGSDFDVSRVDFLLAEAAIAINVCGRTVLGHRHPRKELAAERGIDGERPGCPHRTSRARPR